MIPSLSLLLISSPVMADDDVIVVEDVRPERADELATSASVTVLELDATVPASADVASVVDSASGVRVQRLGGLGDFSAVSIRGSSFKQVQIYLDGVPLNPDGSSTVNLSELPLSLFSRIEVYRGNAPPHFAASPVGGVVNLVTGEERSSAASVAVGSYESSRVTASVMHDSSVAGRRSDLFLATEHFHTGGSFEYFADQGTLYTLTDDALELRGNNDKDQLSLHARGRVHGERYRLQALNSFTGREEGVPGHVNDPASQARLATVRNLAVLQAEGGNERLGLTMRVWDHERREALDDRADELGTGIEYEKARTGQLGLLAALTAAPLPWLVPQVTGQVRRDGYRVEQLDTGSVSAPSLRLALTGAASADLHLLDERLTVSPLALLSHLDNRQLTDEPFDTGGQAAPSTEPLTSLDPRLGLLVLPVPTVALKANAGRYLRPPDFTELFGDRGFVQGNPGLRPERGWQWDVGLRAESPWNGPITGALDVTHFWNAVSDHIVFVQNSQQTSVAVNIGQAWIQGLETALTLDAFGVLDTQTNLTRTVSVNLLSNPAYANKQLPGVPTWEVWQATSVHWDDTVRLGHSWSYTDGLYVDATNYFLAPPRSLHGAFVRVGGEHVDAELALLNLFDTLVEVVDRNPLDPSDPSRIVSAISDFPGYPLPGRTWLFTLSWTA